MKRSEVKTEYTWDLGDIFENVLAWEKQFVLSKKAIAGLGRFRGKLSNREVLLVALDEREEVRDKVSKLYVYAKMNADLDGSNSMFVGLTRRATALISEYSVAVSYIEPELSSLSEDDLEELAYDRSIVDYSYYLQCIAKSKAHILSAKEEKIIANYSQLFGTYRDIFDKIDNVDMPHPKVSDGTGKVELTRGNYSRLMQVQDRAVRRKAFAAFYKQYESRINTIASCYVGSIKCDNINARIRKYDNAMQYSLDGDDVPQGVYNTLLCSVDEALPVLHEYVAYRKEVLGELHMYDMNMPLFGSTPLVSSYEQAYETVMHALSPLGEEYVKMLAVARDNRWIDVEETEFKRGGAYSWGTYGVHPYVLLNYAGTTHDLFTIAHEMGHAMHSYYSDMTQPLSKADYSIFVAEVASTVNEVITCKYLIEKETDIESKKYLLSYYLDMLRTTFFRQAMFAEFEKQVHELDDKGEALTVDKLCKTYQKLNKKYYGNSIVYDKQIKFEWARIPHFYNSFYVYKYATGIVSAVTLARSILTKEKSALDSYYKFLSAGGSKSPYEILCDAGVDLMSSQPYEVAMNEFRSTLKLLKELG